MVIPGPCCAAADGVYAQMQPLTTAVYALAAMGYTDCAAQPV